ncbi:MAG: tetratricopeptide repeat protein, partial [Candidatus Binatia bacterium]
MIRRQGFGFASFLFALFFFASSLGGARMAFADDKKLQQLLDQGSAALKKEDYPAAKKAFENATQLDMGSIAAWRGLGWAYWELGEQDRAIKVWKEALRVRPDDVGILYALGVAAEERQQVDEALAKYGEVLASDSGNMPARMGRVRLLLAQRRHREAESDLNELVAKNPANFEAQFMLAQVYKETGRTEESRRAFQKLAQHRPEPKHLRSLADAMLESGDAKKAIEYYRQNLQAQPGNRGTILGLARAHGELHEYPEAVRTLEQFLAREPDDAKIHEELARFAAYGGDYDKAIQHLETLVRSHPEEIKWQLSLAGAYEQDGRADEAAKTAQAILKRDPDNIEAMDLLYKHAHAAKREDQAIQWLERMIAAKPTAKRWNELGDIHLIRGGVLAEAGAKEDANESYARSAEAYRKATQLNPRDADARLGVATALRLRGEYEGSIEIAEAVLRDYPNVERARRELYESYASLGQYDKAIQQLRTSLAVFPNNPRLEHELARIVFRGGGRAEGIEMMQDLVAAPIQPAVPVLLYHGVSPASTDAETIPLNLFRGHMEMLKKQGYQSITTEELIGFIEGRGTLPAKPVLLTFDDARADSFRYADPVLREMGFRATMFVPVDAVGQHGPFNATWD